jgi:hypothetical protein
MDGRTGFPAGTTPSADRPPRRLPFTLRGTRIGTTRIRRGLDDAVRAARLVRPDGTAEHVTPQHLRDRTGQRRHDPTGSHGAAGPCHSQDDNPLRRPRSHHRSGLIRLGDGQDPRNPAAPPRGQPWPLLYTRRNGRRRGGPDVVRRSWRWPQTEMSPTALRLPIGTPPFVISAVNFGAELQC